MQNPIKIPIQNPMQNLRAFTLIELLVVIVIVGLLVGLLLPAIDAGRFEEESIESIETIPDYYPLRDFIADFPAAGPLTGYYTLRSDDKKRVGQRISGTLTRFDDLRAWWSNLAKNPELTLYPPELPATTKDFEENLMIRSGEGAKTYAYINIDLDLTIPNRGPIRFKLSGFAGKMRQKDGSPVRK